MAAAPHPRMHGLTHVQGGPDPIPGLPSAAPGGDTIDAIIAGLNPAGWWKLDESSGHVAHDSSGNGLDLTSAITGGQDPAWGHAAGPPGTQTADFQTGTGGVGGTAGREARNWATALTGDFTVGIFVSRNDTAFTSVIGQGNPSRAGGGGWWLGVTGATDSPANRPFFNARFSAVYADNPLLASTWAFLAGVHNGTNWTLYVNGLLQSATMTGAAVAAPSPYALWVGQDGGGGGIAVDVPRVVGSYAFLIPSALTGAQLLEIYNSATLPGGADAGKALLATGLGGTEWDFAVEVDTVRYRGIELGTGLAGTDNGDHTVTIAATGGGAPSGAAGGALDGTYPNPGIAATVAGAGLAETANVLSVNVDGATIEINADTLRVKASGVGATELASTAVTAGSYGDASHVPTFTVDADGRLTAAAAVAVSAPAAARQLRASYFAQMPGSLPASSGMFRVPFFAGASVTFTLDRATLHLETAGSTASTLLLEKATPAGTFLAVLVCTLTLAASATDVTVTSSLGTLLSGDLIRWRWTALGTSAQSFYAQLEGHE